MKYTPRSISLPPIFRPEALIYSRAPMEPSGPAVRVDRYLRARDSAAHGDLPRLAADLDDAWWREAERLTLGAARAQADRLLLPPEERLILDAGLLDWRLIPGGVEARSSLLHELYAPGHPHEMYFSEWLALRYRQFVLYGGVVARKETPESGSLIVRSLQKVHYAKLAPLFRNLPGFNRQAVDAFLEGRLDDTLELLAARGDDPQAAAQRRQLDEIRSRMVARARDRARSDEELSLFDALRKLDGQVQGKRSAEPAMKEPAVAGGPSPREREKFLRGELALVRSLLKLGISGSGLKRVSSVLMGENRRCAKADLGPVQALARECDATLPVTPTFLIAPYTGGGFYEWDRDTVFVPLVPTRSSEEAVVSALANYRIMVDALQEGGRLRKLYEQDFGAKEFQPSFVRDYKAWVLGIGRGNRGALEPKRYEFFVRHLGPQPSSLFAPKEWQALTPEERIETIKECRARINRGEDGFEDRYRLAVAYSRDRQHAQALQQVQEALARMPVDGRSLLALAHLSAQGGAKEAARKACAECIALAPGTIWSVYAAEEARKVAAPKEGVRKP